MTTFDPTAPDPNIPVGPGPGPDPAAAPAPVPPAPAPAVDLGALADEVVARLRASGAVSPTPAPPAPATGPTSTVATGTRPEDLTLGALVSHRVRDTTNGGETVIFGLVVEVAEVEDPGGAGAVPRYRVAWLPNVSGPLLAEDLGTTG